MQTLLLHFRKSVWNVLGRVLPTQDQREVPYAMSHGI